MRGADAKAKGFHGEHAKSCAGKSRWFFRPDASKPKFCCLAPPVPARDSAAVPPQCFGQCQGKTAADYAPFTAQ
jgi:hypothetical protein